MYNQKHHKLHSFYNHKFGFHINGLRPEVMEAIRRLRPKVVKTLDFSVAEMKEVREEIPDVFLIGRLFVHPQDFGQLSGGTPQAARERGREMAEKILGLDVNQDQHHIQGQPVIHAWESLNEVFPEWTDPDTQRLYDEYQVAFGQKMRAAGFEPIAFNFGQGNGNGPQWLELYPGTLETYTYLGFHEYDWPTMDHLHQSGLNGPSEPHNLVPGGEGRGNDGMWRALRYRRVMNNGIRQKYGDQHVVIITECGMTQGVWSPAEDLGPWAEELTVPQDVINRELGGAAVSPIPVEDYWRSLLWYNDELKKDDFVLGACLFVTGAAGDPKWETFEHLDTIIPRLEAFQVETSLGTTAATSIPPAISEPPLEPAEIETSAEPEEPSVGGWTFTLEHGQGLPLLVGDIGVKDEPITILKPDGTSQQLLSGGKPEFGQGGFECYATLPGTYQIQFLGQSFEIELSGQQFTKVVFRRPTNTDLA